MHKELLCVLLSVGGELWVTTPYHSFEHLRSNAILFLEDKTKAKHEALHKFKSTVQKLRQKKKQTNKVRRIVTETNENILPTLNDSSNRLTFETIRSSQVAAASGTKPSRISVKICLKTSLKTTGIV